MERANFFGRFKIGTRVYTGFGVVIMLLAVVAVIGIRGFGAVDDIAARYEALAANTERGVAIQRDIADLRRNIRLYGYTGDPQYLPTIKQNMNQVGEALGRTYEKEPDAERKARFAEMIKFFDSYREDFAKAVEARQQRDHIVNDDLIPTGNLMTDRLTELMTSAADTNNFEAGAKAGLVLSDLLKVRLLTTRFLGDNDAASLPGIKKAIEDFVKSTTGLEERFSDDVHKRIARDVDSVAVKYSQHFDGATTTILAVNDLLNNKLSAHAKELAGLAIGISEAQHKSLATIRAEMDRTIGGASSLDMWGAFAAALLGIIFAWIIARSITGPIKVMTAVMTRLAGGELRITVPALDNRDEIGEMAQAVQVFKENALEVERLKAEREAQDRRAVEEKKRSMNQFADGFESSVKHVVSAVSSAAEQLQRTAQSMSANADQTSRQCTIVAAAAEQASANVQTVASATEELTSSINEISRQVSESSRIGSLAVEEANRANTTVNGLSEAAQKIGVVVNLINEIASQTNLLALNATIEAARAGEAGKGFAVVASEVKNLANQTAKATEDIQAQVGQMQSVTGSTVDAIKNITGTIRRMSEISTTIASAVEEQGAATREIARNVSEASKGTQEVSSNISGVAQAAGETGRDAGETLSAANNLGTESQTLSREVERFISTVRHS